MAGIRKRQVTVGTGKLELVREPGRCLLIQGDVAVDVTSVLGLINYPLGCVTLRLRVSDTPRLSLREAPGVTADADTELAAV